MKPAITLYRKRELRAYQVPSGVDEPLGPAVIYRIESDEEVQGHAAAPNLDRVVYTTPNKVTCVDRDGGQLWCYDLEPHTSDRLPRTQCIFSLDGTWVWLYRPDGMAGRGADLLVVLLAKTGEVVAQEELDTVGQGARLMQHPNGRHILLEVGEGQDGVIIFLAELTEGSGIEMHSYGWDDRALIDIAPNGQLFMTVDHGQEDVIFHAFPSGDEVLQLSIADFGYEFGESFVDWGGGFLSTDIAVVTIKGESDDEEWYHFFEVDLRTGKPLGRFEAHIPEIKDFEPLGDGTWIASDANGNPVRHLSPNHRTT